ncbi:MAG TPA: phenylalanine--tRNA ligase subunit beta [Candidatus Saccharimonadales bacterium]|nr:phenylalanine--tRNA ligase subunit beta [Candidatus Saccharimonadales bacterium]
MKISLNSIKAFNQRYGCADDVTADGTEVLVQKIGAQLGAIEEVEYIGEKYQGIVVAKVVECGDHPNADRLHVCKIDDAGVVQNVERDENGYVQVVCGAPNVRAGIMVAWLPPGSTVPESVGKDPFVLETRELRGVKSNGMLASQKELALGDSHDGILEIDAVLDGTLKFRHAERGSATSKNYVVDDDATNAGFRLGGRNDKLPKPGDDFAEAFGLKDDVVLDIENKMFTHRPDCFGFLGVDREIAGIQGIPFNSPDWYSLHPEFPDVEADVLPLEVHNELPGLVPRFMAIAMRDIKIGPSPTWVQVELAKVGLRSINNIVDYTNYFMLLTGQPLHAYDYDKVTALSDGDAATIVVRNPKPDERLTLLNGKEIEPRSEAILIATNQHAIGLGGVMGGGETEVDENTRNIILECATFDMYSIRRTSMAHGLFTDAVTRFNKGQSPLQNAAVLAKIVDEIRTFAGGKVASGVIDVTEVEGREWVHPSVPVTTDFINTRLGFDLSAGEMKTLLENVEFKVELSAPRHSGLDPKSSKNNVAEGDAKPDWIPASAGMTQHDVVLTVTAPFWRTDIESREDIVEEVGRLYGFDKLPLVLPRRSIRPTVKDPLLTFKQSIRENLVKSGANELLTYSFVHGNLLDKVGQDTSHAFKLGNALSPDLQYYRLSLTPSLLEKVHPNIKAGYDEFALFEIGKAHIASQMDDEGLPREDELTALVVAAADKVRNAGAAYYEAKKYLETVVSVQLTYQPIPEDMQKYDITKPFVMNRSAFVYAGDTFLGIIGEYRQQVHKNLKLPKYCAGFELDTEALQQVMTGVRDYTPLPKFPEVMQDISLKVPADVAYQSLYDVVWRALQSAEQGEVVSSLEPLDIYMGKDDKQHKNVTFRYRIASYEKTLKTEEVNALLDQAAVAAKENFGAERI